MGLLLKYQLSVPIAHFLPCSKPTQSKRTHSVTWALVSKESQKKSQVTLFIISAWLHGVTKVYAASFYLSGAMFVLSGLVMVPAIWRCTDKKGSKSVNQIA